MASETKMVRTYTPDIRRLWNLVNAERRTLADVINYLLDQEDQK